MPYAKVSELPAPVKDNLPQHAQEIFMAAYNSAYEGYDPKEHGDDREAYANRVAWAAVGNKYEKNDAGEWVEKKEAASEEAELLPVKEAPAGLLADIKAGFETFWQRLSTLFTAPPDPLQLGPQLVKSADGRDLLLIWSTNAFQDREGEIFTTQSLKDYVAWADEHGDRGTVDFWHIPGTDFATVKEQAVVGRFLLEVAEFNDTPDGMAFKAFLLEHPRGHPQTAPDGWGASHQYRYDPADRADGVYERMRKEKSTLLPGHEAANTWNPQPEVYRMDEKKKKALEAILGAERAAELIAQGEGQTKELEAQGVAFKEEEQESSAPQETPPPEAAPEEEVPEPEPTVEPEATEEKEEAGPAETPPTMPDLAAQLEPAFKAIAETMAELSTRLKALEESAAAEPEPVAEAEKEAEPTPFDSFAALIKASVIGTKEARLDKRTTEGRELTAGPDQKRVHDDGPTPIPVINAMLAGENIHQALGLPQGE